MFHVIGRRFECCDQVPRRSFLRVGALGLGGLSLPALLRHRATAAEASEQARARSAEPAVIYIELAGGPTHIDTYDPKPEAAREIRGPFEAISTKLPGVQLGELMEKQAKIADRLAIIRSIHHNSSSHSTSAHLVQTGHYLQDRQNSNNEMPCVGSVADRVLGAKTEGIPGYVSLQRTMRYGNAAYLGKAHNPFSVRRDPNRGNFRVDNLELVRGLDADRVHDRRYLLNRFDESRRILDTDGVSEAVDQFTLDAFEIVTSGRAQDAFAVTKEPEEVRQRYGRSRTGQEFLLARRLIEAGVTFVSVRVGGWDNHNRIERTMRASRPAYDQALAALVDDLVQRGMDRDVLVVAMGEFGRTPKMNRNAGRDHWGAAMSVLLAGGGLKMGQVIGSTTAKGERPSDVPYRPEQVLAMVYRHLGIDAGQTFIDFSGRPRHLLDDRQLIAELV